MAWKEVELTPVEKQIYELLQKEYQQISNVISTLEAARDLTEKLQGAGKDPETSLDGKSGAILEKTLHDSTLEYWTWVNRVSGMLINILFRAELDGTDELAEIRRRIASEFERLRNENADLDGYAAVLRIEAKRIWKPSALPFSPIKAIAIGLIFVADAIYPDILEDFGPGFSGLCCEELPF
jgi:hypothetical protein